MVAFLISLDVFAAAVIGGGLGLVLAATDNIPQTWHIGNSKLILPSEILSRNGRLIDEFNGVAHHQTISVYKLPRYIVYALLTREDQNFFRQNAFSVRGTLRAAINDLLGTYFSGGSTITQQYAGSIYTNRTHDTIRRKLRELWYSLQVEKRLTKWQILDRYLNSVYFGRNNYGIEAASKFYFGIPASKLTLDQAVALIIQLADPAGLDWIANPQNSKPIQRVVLEEMVRKGYVTQAQADQSFRQFWQNYPYARAATFNPYAETHSKAPYFTSYVRQQLQQDLYGNLNFLRDGLVIHTTLSLHDQGIAQRIMHHYIGKYRAIHQKQYSGLFAKVKGEIVPTLSLLGYSFDLPQITRVSQKHDEVSALNYYLANLNPTVNALATVFGMPHLADFTAAAHTIHQKQQSLNTVEGALITLGDHSGEIRAMIGGYSWQESQFNRAVNARLQEGSSIKPLYYSVAISSGKFTVASPIYDAPTVFWNPDGTPYMPRDFLGQWQGIVSLRWALDDSINVASLKILQAVGFKAAINRISRMMGLWQYRNNPHYFPHVYPLGLGIVPVAPINMARAYATFANQGRLVTPIAIRFVQDRTTGRIILQPELQLRQRQQREGKKLQIMSPQAAYVMVNLLESVVTGGDLWQTYFDVGGWGGMAMAGKTGTTENWDDAWTVGFSPYYTTAVWFGFDHHGASLGLGLTGATGAGPVWAHYMKAIDAGKKPIPFPEPKTGIVHDLVDCYSGLLPTQYSTCTKNEIFIAGTQPTKYDTLARYRDQRTNKIVARLQNSSLVQSLSGVSPASAGTIPALSGSSSSLYSSLPPVATPVLAARAHKAPPSNAAPSASSSPASQQPQSAGQQSGSSNGATSPGYNPLLD